MFLHPKIEVLLIDPVETSKYLPYFSKDFKLLCIDRLAFYAEILIHDPDKDIRIACAKNSEIAALSLISDSEEEVQVTCAETWESCAKQLCREASLWVRQACLKWESCNSLMLFNQNEDDGDILKSVALECMDAQNESEKLKAKEILKLLLEEDEEFALDCIDVFDNELKCFCAYHHRSVALHLINDKDEKIKQASIERLIEDNDWSELDYEELANLCQKNEKLALLILDDHYEVREVCLSCLDNWEACAFELLLHESCEISEYAQNIALKSTNNYFKLNAINDLNLGYFHATIFIYDENVDIRIACIKSDEDFAFQLLDDQEVRVRIACIEYFDCAMKLINDENSHVRKACAEKYYECALQLIKDKNDEVRAAAINTVKMT